ncbi:hypothetical protein SUGI_0366290 [Cryptomeria japonica]|nr:hypothetical protein SUGI_0366290 [Cryptomeria japonica]
MAADFHVFFSLITTATLLTVFVCNLADGAAECKPSERKSLLAFKAGVVNSEGRLQSWMEGTDCCRWPGISCNNTTGLVSSIDLSGLLGRLNGTANMAAICLDLSNAGFSGKIPAELGNSA